MDKPKDSKIKAVILSQGNDLMSKRASIILQADFAANKHISEVKELDMWR